MSFKEKFSVKNRTDESLRVRKKYPDRIPVVIEKDASSDIDNIEKHKYLVPDDLTVGQFVYVIRKRIKLEPEKSIFLLIGNIIPPSSALLSQVYKEHQDVDGYLYIFYTGENVYG
jgi:GABA(A) receptor-associated protein